MHSGSTGRGATIRILLLDGTPEGLRLIDKSNWTGLAMMCSRSKYSEFKNRDEFNYPGVYFLYGISPSNASMQTLYIGQADNIRERLDNHNRAKEFWSDLAVFTSRYGHLNRAHAQYIESRLIELATRARRAEVTNGNAPRLPYLSESDRLDSESFLDQVLLLCPLLDSISSLGSRSRLILRRPRHPRNPKSITSPYHVRMMRPGCGSSVPAHPRLAE
jgi:predicted GIY-YIG superfamily endonuclease